jgi:hypothetical protein
MVLSQNKQGMVTSLEIATNQGAKDGNTGWQNSIWPPGRSQSPQIK